MSVPNSLRLHTPLTVVPTSHLYLGSRSQRKRIARLTPHSSESGSCQYVTHTPLRLHVLRDGAESAVLSSSTVPDVTAAPTYVCILASSNSSPRDNRHRIFSRLSTSSLTIACTLALLTSTVTQHQHRIPIPLLALPNLRFFLDSLPPF